ncbi:MAG: MBL fold metallo-hydrolase [Nannocystaceae bacterium]|nr:MBL fold metallo-hydrolase [Myxococcales bacterium]
MPNFRQFLEGARLERVLASPQYRDGSFRNASGASPTLKKSSALPLAREYLRAGRRTPLAPLPTFDPLPAWRRPLESGLRVTWLGHSTLLIEIDGGRVLTDPVWGERASPTTLAGPRRFQPVPVPIAALPPLDAVVISHDHYDHLCYESVLELARQQPRAPFVTSLGVGARLQAWGIPAARIVELDWWESVEPEGAELRVTAAPSQHFSGRGLRDRNHTLWSSIVVRGRDHAVFFSGDTGLTPQYAEIARRLGPFDLVMLEVGAFHPAWSEIHLGPDNALTALELLGGAPLLPIHWGTFDLALHPWDQPAERLVEVAPSRGVTLVMPRLGVPVEPAIGLPLDPWWRPIAALEPRCFAAPEPAEPLAAVPDPID